MVAKTLLRGLAASLLATLAGCAPAVLDPRGPVSRAQGTILLDSMAIMLTIVVPTILATLAFAWWFRASNTRAQRLPDWAYSGQIEILVWSIPLLTIMLLGGVTWIGAHQLDPGRPLASNTPALEVQVVSLDWKWLFILPEQGVASVNRLVIPAGVPVRFSLTSASVMNAFFVPQLGSMIYTMNGMATQLNLQADAPGIFHGLSSHYSGDGFAGMHFDVQAMPADGFDRWVEEARGQGDALDPAHYAALAVQSTDVRPFTFRSVTPGLFGGIVMQHLPPGPGPAAGQPNRDVSPRAEK
ncbi:MAG: ubiquinol oxidase subunit II [Acetobacteraceae bacterium]|nr:MAG: ubiquinol oxidase subunit II [Acetobacteraceae bacterium]